MSHPRSANQLVPWVGGVSLGQTQGLLGEAPRERVFFFLLALGPQAFPGRGGDREEGLGAVC